MMAIPQARMPWSRDILAALTAVAILAVGGFLLYTHCLR